MEKEIIDENDDDDDDDLEPIESLEPPIKCNVAYIRDFIETLSEDKPYEERLATFSTLPNVVKHQIKHEHPQVSKVSFEFHAFSRQKKQVKVRNS